MFGDWGVANVEKHFGSKLTEESSDMFVSIFSSIYENMKYYFNSGTVITMVSIMRSWLVLAGGQQDWWWSDGFDKSADGLSHCPSPLPVLLTHPESDFGVAVADSVGGKRRKSRKPHLEYALWWRDHLKPFLIIKRSIWI